MGLLLRTGRGISRGGKGNEKGKGMRRAREGERKGRKGGVKERERKGKERGNGFAGPMSNSGWLGSRVVSLLDSGAEGPGFKSQPRRCRVTVLGKLLTPIVPQFIKQQNWQQPSLGLRWYELPFLMSNCFLRAWSCKNPVITLFLQLSDTTPSVCCIGF